MIRRCEVCRQKVFVVEHDIVEAIGAARITRSDHRSGVTTVTCTCGHTESWSKQRPLTPVSVLN